MLALNLPGFAPKVAEKDGKRTIFDPVRQKYVALTPDIESTKIKREGDARQSTQRSGIKRRNRW